MTNAVAPSAGSSPEPSPGPSNEQLKARRGAPTALVFDSGVGGLSVAADIRRAWPGLHLVYVADNAFLPYGEKTEAQLIARVPDLLAHWEAVYHPQLIVIACNTASTIVLPACRARLSVPIIGTVPAVKPAAAQSLSKVIGLLGTPGTVKRAYTDQLIADFANDVQVIRHGSTGLVAIAEAKLRGEAVDIDAVAREIAPIFAPPFGAQIDHIVLACTHFPLLREELAQAAPHAVSWIDSGSAIARRVGQLLSQSDRMKAQRARDLPLVHEPAIFTDPGGGIDRLAPALQMLGLTPIG